MDDGGRKVWIFSGTTQKRVVIMKPKVMLNVFLYFFGLDCAQNTIIYTLLFSTG